MDPVGKQVPEIGPLDPAVVGPEQSRLVGGDTGPNTNYVFNA